MKSLRKVSYAALALAFAQIVFGAIVRITGSGMGCGDHWPRCNGEWFPPHDRLDLIIEITHRYLALGLSILILLLVVMAFARRREPGIGGPGGVLRPSIVAAGLVAAAALLGAVTVKLELNALVVAAHLTIAMSLLAMLVLTTFRAGGLGATSDLSAATVKTGRSATAAVILALATLVLGALTANLPDAASSCGGFPLCRTVNAGGPALTVHIVHRVLAFLLFGHLIGIAIGTGRRGEPRPVITAARGALGAAIVQVLIAAAMVETGFPPVLRSMHQAVGTLVWLLIVILFVLTSSARRETQPGLAGAPG